MFSPDDTVVAIATPPGRGGIGVVRISGPNAQQVAAALINSREPLKPRFAALTKLRRGGPLGPPQAEGRSTSLRSGAGLKTRPYEPGAIADEVVATFFPAPHSYTGQDVVEISAHGSPVVLRGIVEQAIAAGARLAEPGEFTLRAFLNGKRDLVQAEAVADLIDAVTPLQARTAFDQLDGTLTTKIATLDAALFDLIARLEASLDFPDEGYHFIEPSAIATAVQGVIDDLDTLLRDAGRGRMIREGAQVVIAGRPNVGKSSLFNALAGADRAIVTEIPGTTRDLITERIDIDGLPITLIDTAGTRDTLDLVEREGVARGDRARAVADLILVVLDATSPMTVDDERLLEHTKKSRRLVIANKIDATEHGQHGGPSSLDFARNKWPACDVDVSATTGLGLDTLRREIATALAGNESREPAAISNTRHIALLQSAREHLAAARTAAQSETPEEFVLTDLQAARQRFDDVVGRRTTDDLLAHIFERFCIGK